MGLALAGWTTVAIATDTHADDVEFECKTCTSRHKAMQRLQAARADGALPDCAAAIADETGSCPVSDTKPQSLLPPKADEK